MKTTPPTALAELQAWPHWVCWKIVERDGKPTKVPVRPNGKPASSTDPETWSTHAECVRAYERGRYDGIGYVFAEDDEYAGVDLDHCVTGGRISFGARVIIDRLASYTELSPSGTGAHVIVRAGLNGGRKRTGKTPWGGEFENYDRGRFFTITGNHVKGTPETIESRQAELDAVRAELFPTPPAANVAPFRGKTTAPSDSDADLIEKIRASKQGPKFADLYDSGAPEGQESEADLGLCNILAFWCGDDPARIDALFRSSALMRDKWDSPRGDTTYGGYTIARSLEGRTAFYRQKGSAPAAKSERTHDDPELTYEQEISGYFGLIDDPIVSGWRSSRKATSRVVFTTRSGAVLDLDSWKAATGTPTTLAQEIGVQLGVEVTLKKEDIKRLNVLVGKFCTLVEADTVEHKARDLGEALLQAAEKWPVQMEDQASRANAFNQLRARHPATKAKADGVSLGEACLVLEDTATGKRYVRVQWFVDYVKANAVSSTVPAILEQIEAPGWWSRPNASGKFKATDPASGKPIYQRLFEVPADWEAR